MKVGRKQFSLFAIGILVFLYTVGMLFFSISVTNRFWAIECAVVCLIHYIYIVISWASLKISFFSPKTLFLLALILFHEGNVLVAGFFAPTFEEKQMMMLYRYGEAFAFEATRYIMMFILVYVLLIIITHKIETPLECMDEGDSSKRMQFLGNLLLMISVPATLYTDMKMIMARTLGGYGGVYEADMSFHGIPLGYFTKMFFPAILLLLISRKKNKKSFQRVMIIALLYYVVRMLLIGRKADSILAILPILAIYYHFYRPKIKIWYVLSAYGLMYLLVLTTKLRGLPMDMGFMPALIEAVKETNPLKDLLIEMGGTIKAVMQVMMAIPETGSYRGGITYLWAIPGGLLQGFKIPVEGIFSQTQMELFLNLPERGAFINSTVFAMGGSAIAEWYFNFGWIGITLLPIFVWAVNKLDKAYMHSQGCSLKFVYYNIFLYYFLRYSRQYVIELVWNPFFSIGVIIVLNWLFFPKRYQESNNLAER